MVFVVVADDYFFWLFIMVLFCVSCLLEGNVGLVRVVWLLVLFLGCFVWCACGLLVGVIMFGYGVCGGVLVL